MNNIAKHLFSKDGGWWLLYYAVNATPLAKAVPDKWFLTLQYRCLMGKLINWKNPQTFNEKLQWLKVYNRRPEYTMMVDKVKVKDYVAGIIGDEYIIPTLGVWDRPEDIDFDKLPEKFVLKCNHDSGSICICRDKSKFDKEAAIKKLHAALKRDMYYAGREWPYKNVEKKVFAEQLMEDKSDGDLKDYKLFCMNGNPEVIQVDYGRFTHHMRNLYDKDWAQLEMEIMYPSDASHAISRPAKLQEMKELAHKLSDGIPYVRVDFYSIEDKLYWGELTFFNEAGLGTFRPEEWDEKLGKLIVLPNRGGYLIVNEGFSLWLHAESKQETPMVKDLRDYKFYCFNGEPKLVMVAGGRQNGNKRFGYYTTDWAPVEITWGAKRPEVEFERPTDLDDMLKIASRLSANLPHARIDLYNINEKVYFGEITFFDASGCEKISPESFNSVMGEWIKLPESSFHRIGGGQKGLR